MRLKSVGSGWPAVSSAPPSYITGAFCGPAFKIRSVSASLLKAKELSGTVSSDLKGSGVHLNGKGRKGGASERADARRKGG